MAPVSFKGVFPIVITPFDDNENIDLESFDRIIRFMGSIGADGVTILGVLGESNRLTDKEREALTQTAVAASDGLPIIVGTSHPGTRATCDLSQRAEALGAAGVMVTPSREAVPNPERIFEYFQRIAQAISIPIVAQDHPASTQVHMALPLVLRLLNEIPQIACIKQEATPTPPKTRALIAQMPAGRTTILTGLGALYGQYDLASGADGFMTGFAFPEVLQALVRAHNAGQHERVHNIYQRFLPLIVFEQQPSVAVRKEIFRLRGLAQSSQVRHPATSIDADTAVQLQAILQTTLPDIDITQPISI
ncbi:MAG: dihydrodipicolinate synthase family protein [Candidatus Latescibacterota bacterium]|nr:dihydrodipicolinate synthase family protein [Candidatus Latescibacterota bacterium]